MVNLFDATEAFQRNRQFVTARIATTAQAAEAALHHYLLAMLRTHLHDGCYFPG